MYHVPIVIQYLKDAAVFDYKKIEQYTGIPALMLMDSVDGINELNDNQIRILEWFLTRIGVDFAKAKGAS